MTVDRREVMRICGGRGSSAVGTMVVTEAVDGVVWVAACMVGVVVVGVVRAVPSMVGVVTC